MRVLAELQAILVKSCNSEKQQELGNASLVLFICYKYLASQVCSFLSGLFNLIQSNLKLLTRLGQVNLETLAEVIRHCLSSYCSEYCRYLSPSFLRLRVLSQQLSYRRYRAAACLNLPLPLFFPIFFYFALYHYLSFIGLIFKVKARSVLTNILF